MRVCVVCTHYAVGHQSSLHKTRQHISRVVLVVGDAREAGVKSHHQQGELQQRAEEAGPAPREPGLQVELGGEEEKTTLNATVS